MREYGELKKEILNIFSDGDVHSSDEILNLINEKFGNNISIEHIRTAISQLRNNGEPIKRVSKGNYIRGVDAYYRSEIIKLLKKWNKELQSRSSFFDISEYEYGENKRLFQKNQEYIDDLIRG